jgi:hypothetical protein
MVTGARVVVRRIPAVALAPDLSADRVVAR